MLEDGDGEQAKISNVKHRKKRKYIVRVCMNRQNGHKRLDGRSCDSQFNKTRRAWVEWTKNTFKIQWTWENNHFKLSWGFEALQEELWLSAESFPAWKPTDNKHLRLHSARKSHLISLYWMWIAISEIFGVSDCFVFFLFFLHKLQSFKETVLAS